MVNRISPRCLTKQFGNFQEVDQLLNHFFGANVQSPTSRSSWQAPVSLSEDQEHFYVEIDLPGIAQEDLDLSIEKRLLTITATRKEPKEERNYWHQEHVFGSVTRSVSLPESVDSDSIEAELSQGLLLVKLAKLPEAQSKQIEVKTG